MVQDFLGTYANFENKATGMAKFHFLGDIIEDDQHDLVRYVKCIYLRYKTLFLKLVHT